MELEIGSDSHCETHAELPAYSIYGTYSDFKKINLILPILTKKYIYISSIQPQLCTGGRRENKIRKLPRVPAQAFRNLNM